MTGRDLRRPGRGAGIAATAAPLAAVALAVFAGGGYSAGARVAFGVAAVAALAVVASGEGWRVAATLVREPVVLVLLGLAALGALSALWTLGPVDRTLRWALVCAGYAAVAVAAGVVARRRGGVEALAAAVAALALVAGAAGLVAAAAFEPPYAEQIASVWRPGGPFEYPPALALLEVSALPALLTAMTWRSRWLGGAGAVGTAVAGGVLALSASRVSLAMAVAVGAIALAAPGGTAGARRTSVAAALGLATAAGALVQIVAGSPAGSGPSESVRVVAVIAVVALAAPVWLVIRAALERRTRDRSPREGSTLGDRARPVWIAVAVIALSVLAGSMAFGASAGRGAGAAAGFLHGRDSTWGAAIETFADRPLRGAGADAFLAASARHQGGQTIAFAHDLPLELGAELGVGGLLLALALYAATARSLWRARGSPAVWLLGPAAAAFLVASLVDWPWHLAGAGAVWALAAGALAGAPMSGPKTAQ